MSGEGFDLNDNENILNINTPKNKLGGPYSVVYKNTENRWVIVALDWDGEPRLGIRWFWGNSGSPTSRGYPSWFIVPDELTKMILAGLPLNHKYSTRIDQFLNGDISGDLINH